MLEPEIAAFIERTAAIYAGHSTSLPPSEQRAIYERYAAALTPAFTRRRDSRRRCVSERAPGIRSGCGFIGIVARRAGQPGGTVLYFHGGGFVLGSLDSHQIVTARLAADTGLDVIAVDYRLAPEHRAPAAHDDCLEVTLAALAGRLPFDSLCRGCAAIGGRQRRRQSRCQRRDAAAR